MKQETGNRKRIIADTGRKQYAAVINWNAEIFEMTKMHSYRFVKSLCQLPQELYPLCSFAVCRELLFYQFWEVLTSLVLIVFSVLLFDSVAAIAYVREWKFSGKLALRFWGLETRKAGRLWVKICRGEEKILIKNVKNFQRISAKTIKKLDKKSGQGLMRALTDARV